MIYHCNPWEGSASTIAFMSTVSRLPVVQCLIRFSLHNYIYIDGPVASLAMICSRSSIERWTLLSNVHLLNAKSCKTLGRQSPWIIGYRKIRAINGISFDQWSWQRAMSRWFRMLNWSRVYIFTAIAAPRLACYYFACKNQTNLSNRILMDMIRFFGTIKGQSWKKGWDVVKVCWQEELSTAAIFHITHFLYNRNRTDNTIAS